MTICMMTNVHHTIFRHMKENKNCYWFMFDWLTAIKQILQNHVFIHDFTVELSLRETKMLRVYVLLNSLIHNDNNKNAIGKVRCSARVVTESYRE